MEKYSGISVNRIADSGDIVLEFANEENAKKFAETIRKDFKEVKSLSQEGSKITIKRQDIETKPKYTVEDVIEDLEMNAEDLEYELLPEEEKKKKREESRAKAVKKHEDKGITWPEMGGGYRWLKDKDAQKRDLNRYVADVYYHYGSGKDDYSIEELDIDTKSSKDAKKIAEIALELGYQPGWKKIVIRGPMTGLYM